jgi:hypothetical protein
LLPSGEAPEVLRKRLNLRTLTTDLALQGSEPRWKSTDATYRESPYVLLRIERYDRLPREMDTDYRRFSERAEGFLRLGKLDIAHEANKQALVELSNDRIFTVREARLERRRAEARMLRIEIAAAESKRDSEKARRLRARLGQDLQTLLQEFQPILTEVETKELRSTIAETSRVAE